MHFPNVLQEMGQITQPSVSPSPLPVSCHLNAVKTSTPPNAEFDSKGDRCELWVGRRMMLLLLLTGAAELLLVGGEGYRHALQSAEASPYFDWSLCESPSIPLHPHGLSL